MFREELEDLKNLNLGRLALVHILSREQQDIELFNGRIDKAKCGQLLDHWLDLASVDAAFICGPQDMMLQVSEALRERGLDQRRIKFELFATAEPGRRARKAVTETASRAELCRATVTIDGRSRELEIAKNGLTVLDAALQEGMELPYRLQGRGLLDLPRDAVGRRGRHGRQLRARGLRDRPRLHPDLPELSHQRPAWRWTSTSDGAAMTNEDSLLSYVAGGGKLSAPDNAPPRYRAELLRLMAVFINSELAGATGFADCINLAPGVRADRGRPDRAREAPPRGDDPAPPGAVRRQHHALCQRPSLGRPP